MSGRISSANRIIDISNTCVTPATTAIYQPLSTGYPTYLTTSLLAESFVVD